MIRICGILGSVLVLVLLVAPLPAQAQQAPKVSNVLAFDVGGDVPAFLGFVERANKIADRLGNKAVVRVFQSTLAGPQTGTILVVVEHESLATMAAEQAKTAADPEWQKFLADLQAAGISIVSNSVAVEITP